MNTKTTKSVTVPVTHVDEARVAEMIASALDKALSNINEPIRAMIAAALAEQPKPSLVSAVVTPEEKQALLDMIMPPGQVMELVPGEVGFAEMTVNYELRSPYAYAPVYATDGSSAMDLHAPSTIPRMFVNSEVTIDTGIAVAVPKGYALLIFSRSGHGFNCHTRLANCVGVIDSDYRGTIRVKLVNDGGGKTLELNGGDRIAQCMLVPAPRINLHEVQQLDNTERGEGGLGSTGA